MVQVMHPAEWRYCYMAKDGLPQAIRSFVARNTLQGGMLPSKEIQVCPLKLLFGSF